MSLPIEQRPRPLRHLFLDLNAYFASVEQQERPELRGKPVAVVPVEADSSFVIAASYEAKARGVKTGTRIGDARELCPQIHLIKARPRVYVAYHHRVLEVVESVLPIEQVCSIDEMRFRLLGEECAPARARELGLALKKALRQGVGDQIGCSVGIAPNPFLAKVATELQKPDGLVTITADELPQRLHELKLTDFPGINKRMAARLNGAGIFTTEQMCAESREGLKRAFGSVIGEKWFYLLRGVDMPEDSTHRRSLSHSHVLPPDLRTDKGCREVLLRLLQKASARLRAERLWTQEMSVMVKGEPTWEARAKFGATQDTVRLNEEFLELWKSRSFSRPRAVAVSFGQLHVKEEVTGSLFDVQEDRHKLNEAVDTLNQKFGKNTIFLAGMESARDTADEKIAFQKTWLFSEGKGDNEWVDTFRGLRERD